MDERGSSNLPAAEVLEVEKELVEGPACYQQEGKVIWLCVNERAPEFSDEELRFPAQPLLKNTLARHTLQLQDQGTVIEVHSAGKSSMGGTSPKRSDFTLRRFMVIRRLNITSF